MVRVCPPKRERSCIICNICCAYPRSTGSRTDVQLRETPAVFVRVLARCRDCALASIGGAKAKGKGKQTNKGCCCC